MSQERAVPASAASPEDFSRWPEELCRRELPTALPQLLSDSWNEHIQILKIIVEMFLPHMNHLTLEQTFFSQVLPKTVKLFDDMMYELSSQARELSSQNLEIQTTLRNILQTMVQVLGALTGCVQHVSATQESVILRNIQSLPSSVLHVIRSTFVHCKNSESVYSGRLHLVSDLLQALFKEAYSLQKQLMELLDVVCMDPGADENDDVLNMVFVIHSLLDICSVISSMDHAFHANTWKFIIKQSLKHQSVIKSQLKHKDIIASLCEDILCSFQSCLQLAEQMAPSGAQIILIEPHPALSSPIRRSLRDAIYNMKGSTGTQCFETLKNGLPCLCPSPFFAGTGMQAFCPKQSSTSGRDRACVLDLLFENIKIKALDLIVRLFSNEVKLVFNQIFYSFPLNEREEFKDNTDYRLFQKTLKLCRFLANSLLHYTKEFLPFLSDACCELHQLYLQIHSKFPPSLYAAGVSQAQQEEIAGTFLVTLDPLVPQLLAFPPFVCAVLDSGRALPCELQLPQCLLLVAVMDALPAQPREVQSLWCAHRPASDAAPRVPLLKALFCSFEQCSGELSLPVHLQGVKGRGRAEVAVPLYQHVCAHLCGFIASFHPSLFPELDAALLRAVLSANMITALLAMDAWCFLARYGTAELCAHHVTVVAYLIKSRPGECAQLANLSLLLRRLCFFMAPPQQVEFIQTFPPEAAENLSLWQHISFQAFPAELRKQAAREVARVGTAQSRGWLHSSRAEGELESLNTALSALLAVCNSAGEVLGVGQQTAVMEAGSQLWAFLNANLVIGQAYVQQTLSLLFPLLGFFIQTLDPQLITQVVTLQASLLGREPPDHVRLAILDFVCALGKPFLSPAIQDRMLPSLCSVFASLLADRNWLLEQHALEAFTQFAEGTNHEDIVPQCLRSEDTKNRVVSFLEKTGFAEETAAARVERAKREKGVFRGSLAEVPLAAARWSSSEPSAKRARPELPWEEECRSALRAAGAALEAAEALLRKAPAPDWLPTEVLRLQGRVDALTRRGPQGES